MDTRQIEKLDRRRYIYTLWAAIGFAFFGGCIIADEFVTEDSASSLLKILNKVFLAIFLIGLSMRNFNQFKIESNADLKKALNNELVKLYEYKAFKIGFWAMYATAVILLIIASGSSVLTVVASCLIILYVPFMTYIISYLIYLRR